MIRKRKKHSKKKTILIDLDGVLNTYGGNYDPDYIPPMQCGVYEFLEKLNQNYEIKVFTTRNKLLTAKWLLDNNIEKFIDDITNVKEPCWLYIDDRCIKFNGNFSNLEKEIERFKPWYK